jgi:adenylate cyclase
MASVRRLTAILAADVAGYSRLMGADEEGTHERLRAHLRDLIDPKVAEHRGRIVKNTGDGFLAEFPSVVDAVRCAAEIQRGMAEREPGVPEDRRIEFRVGINRGDVIAEGEDIFGDGVNVAARLEALAEPGGICVSWIVRDQVRDRVNYAFEDLGEQSVKNIARPVRVYALRPPAPADVSRSRALVISRRRRAAVAVTGVIASVAVFVAAVIWWGWPVRTAPTTSQAVAAATSMAQPLVAPRLSIVVLPFANLSNNPDEQYFADGITEDLTTDLSRLADMFVISRNTAFTYRNKAVDTKQIGRELGVRYVLEGSVRRSGDKVRVNSELTDAETDAHLWAEQFNRDIGDLFSLQTEVTSRIAIALNTEMIDSEAARPTDSPDALDYILRGRAAMYKSRSRETNAAAKRALALDPQSVEAQSLLVMQLVGRILDFGSSSQDADIKRAGELATKAVAAAPSNALAHAAKGEALRIQRRCAEAIPEYEAALALNRNFVTAFATIGRYRIWLGLIDDGIAAQEQAIRLSPRDPYLWIGHFRIGEGRLLQSRIDEATRWLETARNANPAPGFVHVYLAAAYPLRGDADLATAELAEARRLGGEGSYSSLI